MSKLRVLHFELDKNLGGIETFLFNLFKQIDKSKIQFEFITTAKKSALEDQLVELGAIIHHISPHRDVLNYCNNINQILKSGVDIIHVHKNSAVNIIPIVLGRICGIKKIFVHSHNTAPSKKKVPIILHKVNRFCLNQIADKRLACSTEAGKWMFGNYPFEIITNGILTEDFSFNEDKRNKKRKELGINPTTLVYGNIGRFCAQKNQLRAIEIFAYLEDLHPDSKMLFVGDGELLQQMKLYAERKKLEEKILFLGLRYDIPELLMAMDSFLMPSLYEGLPFVAIEAQASGLPMFLSDRISAETEITNAVKWFSLDDSNLQIARLINDAMVNEKHERHMLLNQVISNGYDMRVTAEKMLTYYLE